MKRRSIILAISAAAALIGVAAEPVPSSNKDIIPLIEMENVPLTTAIRQIARQARLNIVLDPRLAGPPFSEMTVSIRWENVNARDALRALLDNYGLVLVNR